MHGAGNDFVIIDRRRAEVRLAPERVARMADRHRGIGFDQLITIEAPRNAGALAAYSILNADASPPHNAAMAHAAWRRLLRDGAVAEGGLVLDSPAGVSSRADAHGIVIDMGVPVFPRGPSVWRENRPIRIALRWMTDHRPAPFRWATAW